eukprot:CAMPEP_0177768712 /NCGR_PEP_ID=MMETSP0491_2-20121128/9877_1 /TAXON_ID=63592 /ORGANISM="Tetraselmis chuii, Strain PLY429" /LENGTH=431 /DNA_ID=CAMNT_0019285557 /DNA_START=335 /DNA_END=1630 /DNA_ORIENTATION=-
MLPHSGSGVPTLARASPELHEFQALGDVLERIPNSDSAQLSEEVLTSREAFSCGREERAGDSLMPQVSEAVVGSGGVGLLKGADPDDTVMRRNSNSFTSSSHRGSSDTIYVVSGRRGGDATSGISSAFCFDFRVPEELLGVTVGPMIGSGSSGKVYRGLWNQDVVAVKIVPCRSDDKLVEALNEGALGVEMQHPNLLKTLAISNHDKDLERIVRTVSDEEDDETAHTVWIIQEHCDRGSLIDAVESGWLKQGRLVDGEPDFRAIYQTLLDIAGGMAYMHSLDLLHCDLNGRNVMLKRSDSDPRGFTAVVCDFGLARVCSGRVLSADMIGTVTHMAPELLTDGEAGLSADVWGFGILMWEMLSGCRAYQGRTVANVIFLVTSGKGRLELSSAAPAAYRDIMNACLQYEAYRRPSFVQLEGMLQSALLAEGEA